MQWVYNVLLHRAYMDGTRYYTSADSCLFFFSRLLLSSDDLELHSTFAVLLRERVRERIGASGDALQLAMRLLTCQIFGLRSEVDRRALLDLQQDDGGWDACWLCKYGSSGLRLGNRGVTTALAVKAIEASFSNKEETIRNRVSKKLNGGLQEDVSHVWGDLEKAGLLASC